ncbi:hypothetical protein BT69DRAFT_1276482 [Atractiella rhizophila]|nr:hypothetical protein BT69DRAFT_1276482 [Atractiella rhizophila]
MIAFLLITLLFTSVSALSLPADPLSPSSLVERGDQPNFPSDIPSCVACQPKWGSISSCAEAAPVFQNISNIFWNPAAFVTTIKCACTDTFQAAYPACSDCFVETNQCASFLDIQAGDAPQILKNMRSVCSFGSTAGGFGVASSYYLNSMQYTYTGEPNQPDVAPTFYGPGGINLGSQQGAGERLPVRWHTVAFAFIIALGIAEIMV